MSLLPITDIPPRLDLGPPARRIRFALPSLTAEELQTQFYATIWDLAYKAELFMPDSLRLLMVIKNTFKHCIYHIPEMLCDRESLHLPTEFFTDYYLTKFRLVFTSSVLAELPDGIPGEVARIDVVIAIWAIAAKILWKGEFAEKLTLYILNCPRV